MKAGLFLWFCACIALMPLAPLVQGAESAPDERVVRTPQGPVRGYKQPGDSVYVFYNIPYASLLPGPHKFKGPGPAPMWFDIFDAVDKGIICPQTVLLNVTWPNMNTHDDCLIANVYVPDTEEKKLPVIVYVHGGGYQVGSGMFLEAKNLVRSKKVILVTFNYRLGIHGFLCLGSEDIPGNAGMKDQVALLRWVKKNIHSYGGNAKDVTIAGFSAGSSAVDLLMLSPLAVGLFNKVIPESGSSLAPWSIQVDPIENAKVFAKSMGLEDVENFYALEEFYKSAAMEVLTSTSEMMNRTDVSFLFSPCVERKTSEEAFLTDTPYNILKSGKFNKVPMLKGFADMEGLLRLGQFNTSKDQMNAKFSDFLPIDLQFESEKEREEIGERIKQFYFGDKPVSEENILSFINFNTDVFFGYSTLKALQLNVEAGNNNIYLYEFNFVDDSVPAIPHTDNVKGALHCAQTFAVFDGLDWNLRDETDISEEYKKVKAVTREIWLNFIQTGNPVPAGSALPAWPPAGANGAPHMSIGRSLELRGALLEQRVRFWDAIYERHYRTPQPPPTPPPKHTEL